MPAWIDPLFELLWKHSELAAKESWELVTPGSFPGDGSGIGEDFNFDAMCVLQRAAPCRTARRRRRHVPGYNTTNARVVWLLALAASCCLGCGLLAASC